MPGHRPPRRVLLAAAVLVLVFWGCSGDGEETVQSAPSFCPGELVALLQAVQRVNSPPCAYYQSLSVRTDTSLLITLLACDPDHPSSSAGLSWDVVAAPSASFPFPGPINGSLSALAGTYPAAVVTYTPRPQFAGSDSFLYRVTDDHGAVGNTAEISISVLPVPVALLVSGPASAFENTAISFVATVDWIGTALSDETPRSVWTTDSQYASFTSPGVMRVGNVPFSLTVTVTAVFSANGASVSDTLRVSVPNLI